MKKILTILSAIFITLFSLNAKAQDDAPHAKSYMALYGGLSTPLSNFSQTSYSNNGAGFAKTGATFGLDGGIYLYKNFGIGLTFSFQDQGELNAANVQTLATGYNNDFTKDVTQVTAVGRYHNINMMVGPQYSFLYKSFTLDLRASAGMIKSISTPSTSVVFDYSSSSVQTLEQLSSAAEAFAYGGSVGLRYSIGDSWDVGIKANYINSTGIKVDNANDPGTTGRFVTKQPIAEFQTTVGIILKF